MRAMFGALWGLVIGGASGCLLITDTINVPPTVSIVGPDNVRRGPKHMFRAQLKDPDDEVAFDWRWDRTCPSSLEVAAATGNKAKGTGPETSVTFAEGGFTDKEACVWVVARNERGARSVGTHLMTVSDPVLEVSGPATLVGGKEATFTASYAAEPDTKGRFFLAVNRSGDCSDALVQARAQVPRQSSLASIPSPDLLVGQGSHLEKYTPRRTFCVAAVAVDQFGVEATGTRQFDTPPPGDSFIRLAAPAQQDVSKPLPLFTEVRLAAGGMGEFRPEDGFSFEWKVTGPDGAAVQTVACGPAAPASVEHCLQPTTRGAYVANLTVIDGATRIQAPPLTFQVEDQAPCITATVPSLPSLTGFIGPVRVSRPFDEPVQFEVLRVNDDGDPLPPPGHLWQGGFTWYVRRPEEKDFRRLVDAIYREHIIAGREYRPGDRVEVRVEYTDRVGLGDPAQRSFAHCPADQATCSVNKDDGCIQRVTWTVEYR